MAEAWSPKTREQFFYGTLALTAVGVAWLFFPFLDVLVFAGVVATVSSPLHARLTARLGGRSTLAAVIVFLAMSVAIFLPLGLLAYRVAVDGLLFVYAALDDLAQPERANWFTAARETWMRPAVEVLQPLLGDEADVVDQLATHLRGAATTALQSVTAAVPGLLGGVTSGFIDLLLFVFTVVVLLADGARVAAFLRRLSPLDEQTEERLFEVFREFASNMVVGGFGTAAAMGVVATVGYLIFGVPRPLFFGMLTAVGSFAPVIGTAIVAVPLVIWVGAVHGWGWGLGLAAWSIGLTGPTDNVLRPLFMRGSSDIHPLLLFFAVFGGMYWLGLTGVLVGPVIVAFFLAMAQMLREHQERGG